MFYKLFQSPLIKKSLTLKIIKEMRQKIFFQSQIMLCIISRPKIRKKKKIEKKENGRDNELTISS